MDQPDEFRFVADDGKTEIVLTRREGMRYALSFMPAGLFTLQGFLPPPPIPVDPVDPVDPDVPAGSVSVLSHGAKGDGNTDDTKAIQKALDSGNPNVVFPGGKVYMVRGGGNGTNTDPDCPLNVRSKTTLWMEGATVKLFPDQKEFTSVVRLKAVEDVTFRGGRIDGSKAGQHPAINRGQNGGCHGFTVDGGKRIEFYDVTAVDCFVDGWLMRRGVADVIMDRCQGLGNRRQGMSIIKMDGLVCHHSTFAGTKGQKPEAGVDVEPDSASETNRNLVFEDCKFIDNNGAGFMVHTPGAPLDGLTLRRCTFKGNRRTDSVDIAFANIDAVMSNVLIDDCNIERRIELYGKDPSGRFVNWNIKSNNLRGTHAAIRTHGFTPTGNSVRIAANEIASGRSNPIYGGQPGVSISDNVLRLFP